MTFASKGTGSAVGSTTANQSSIALTTATTAMAVGDFGVVLVAGDNNQTTDGDEGMVTTVTDSVGNLWKKAVEFTNGQGTAQTGAVCSLWYTNCHIALGTGGTITANLSNAASRDAMCIAFFIFTKAAGQIGLLVGTPGTLADDALDPSSLDVTTTAVSHLRVRGIGSETNSATALTVTASWTTIPGTQVGASAAAGSAVRGEFIVSALANQASNPTYVAADHASVYAAFEECTIMGQAVH
jgi:hypothetical protein